MADGLMDRIQRQQEAQAGRDVSVAGRDIIMNFGQVYAPTATFGQSGAATDDRTRRVFVVHGRNDAARSAMFAFLRSIGLDPIEWSQAVQMTGDGSPYIGQVLDTAFGAAQAVVVLLTPDDVAYLREDYASGPGDRETEPQAQARPNVLFEAGMAMGRDAKRTVLVELGQLRPFSDVAGRHSIRINDSAAKRNELAQRLQTAGCAVNLSGNDWLTAGDFKSPTPPGRGLPFKRVASSGNAPGVRVDARFRSGGRGQGRLYIVNQGSADVHSLAVEFPAGLEGFHIIDPGFPLEKLPAGKTVSIVCALTMPRNFSHFNLTITGFTVDGDPIREEVFIDLGV